MLARNIGVDGSDVVVIGAGAASIRVIVDIVKISSLRGWWGPTDAKISFC
jgi:hypothetical protein